VSTERLYSAAPVPVCFGSPSWSRRKHRNALPTHGVNLLDMVRCPNAKRAELPGKQAPRLAPASTVHGSQIDPGHAVNRLAGKQTDFTVLASQNSVWGPEAAQSTNHRLWTHKPVH
jgi:hypothetical protein